MRLQVFLKVSGSVFRAFAGAYALNTLLFLLLRDVVGERWPLIALFNSLLHLLLLPAVFLLPLCLIWRRWWLSASLLPAALVLLSAYSVFFLPKAAALTGAPTITLLTYNMHYGQEYTERWLQLIRDANADIVALQEVSSEAAGLLNTRLAALYPYRAIHTNPTRPILGQAVLSRFPIVEDAYWRIYRAHQRVVLAVDGAPVVLYNLHPAQPLGLRGGFDIRREEIDALVSRAESEILPVLLAGDFNMTDQSEVYHRVTQQFEDAYRAAGWGMGFTWPDFSLDGPRWRWIPPLLRLDYVFYDAHFQAVEARVWGSAGGSDHRPVWVRLALLP